MCLYVLMSVCIPISLSLSLCLCLSLSLSLSCALAGALLYLYFSLLLLGLASTSALAWKALREKNYFQQKKVLARNFSSLPVLSKKFTAPNFLTFVYLNEKKLMKDIVLCKNKVFKMITRPRWFVLISERMKQVAQLAHGSREQSIPVKFQGRCNWKQWCCSMCCYNKWCYHQPGTVWSK